MPRHATRNPPRYFVETDHSYDRPYAVVDSRTGDVIDRRYATRQKAVDLAAAENEAAARPHRSESFAYAYMPNGSAQRRKPARKSSRNGSSSGLSREEVAEWDEGRSVLRSITRFVDGRYYDADASTKQTGRGYSANVTVRTISTYGYVNPWAAVGFGLTKNEAIADAFSLIDYEIKSAHGARLA